MLLGAVIGSVWATKKLDALTGQAFLLVAPRGAEDAPVVCADQAGAGPGDLVLVVTGSSARHAAGAHVPIDAAIVGIVDHVDNPR